MTRLTDEEFRAWCQRNNIEPETESYIQRLRKSPPNAKGSEPGPNVSGRYPSRENGSLHPV